MILLPLSRFFAFLGNPVESVNSHAEVVGQDANEDEDDKDNGTDDGSRFLNATIDIHVFLHCAVVGHIFLNLHVPGLLLSLVVSEDQICNWVDHIDSEIDQSNGRSWCEDQKNVHESDGTVHD